MNNVRLIISTSNQKRVEELLLNCSGGPKALRVGLISHNTHITPVSQVSAASALQPQPPERFIFHLQPLSKKRRSVEMVEYLTLSATLWMLFPMADNPIRSTKNKMLSTRRSLVAPNLNCSMSSACIFLTQFEIGSKLQCNF